MTPTTELVTLADGSCLVRHTFADGATPADLAAASYALAATHVALGPPGVVARDGCVVMETPVAAPVPTVANINFTGNLVGSAEDVEAAVLSAVSAAAERGMKIRKAT